MMPVMTKRFLVAILLAWSLVTAPQSASAAEQKLLAVVNDQPITSHDIDQQIKLNRLLGANNENRKKALNDIINQVVKIEEAKRYRMQPSDAEIDVRLAEFAKGLKTTNDGLEGKLNAQGISLTAMRQHLSAQMSFARLLRYKYKEKLEASDAEVDRKLSNLKSEVNARLAKVMADPRMKTIKVASLMEINFPVENVDQGMEQLLQSRAAEANQFLARFKGCKTARAAASGIFNVKVGKPFDADLSKLPKPLQEVLQKQGPNSAIGPMRSKAGIQVLGFCGMRTVTPQKPKFEMPSRTQLQQAVVNEKYDAVEGKYVAQMRKNAIIEYRDPSYAQ